MLSFILVFYYVNLGFINDFKKVYLQFNLTSYFGGSNTNVPTTFS